jgi:hypothetical protein
MEQVIECLLAEMKANQEEMKTSQENMEAQMNANQEERKARIEANQESMWTIWYGTEAKEKFEINTEANLEKTNTILEPYKCAQHI